MLRLIESPRAATASELQRVSISGLDPDLAAYIERQLLVRWPRVIVQHVGDASGFETGLADPASTDLWICGSEPRGALLVPTLWLGEVDRGARVVRVGERLWKCSTPITGRRLAHTIDALWRQLAA